MEYRDRHLSTPRPPNLKPADGEFFIVTCEHGGNRIPSRYRQFFHGHEGLLHTHRGYDPGALRLARDLATALAAPLTASTVTRLLIDLNRSPRHPDLYSEATRDMPPAIREEIRRRYYQPYRTRIETQVARAVAAGMRVIHISCHSFTPALHGQIRNTDIGLLYDPSRRAEAEMCRRWQAALKVRSGMLKVRMNYPYKGTTDGFTVYLRRCFPPENYIGIELEINQKHALAGVAHWRMMRNTIIKAFQDVV